MLSSIPTTPISPNTWKRKGEDDETSGAILRSKGYLGLQRRVSLNSDISLKISHNHQPIKRKTKTNQDLIIRVFLSSKMSTIVYFQVFFLIECPKAFLLHKQSIIHSISNSDR